MARSIRYMRNFFDNSICNRLIAIRGYMFNFNYVERTQNLSFICPKIEIINGRWHLFSCRYFCK